MNRETVKPIKAVIPRTEEGNIPPEITLFRGPVGYTHNSNYVPIRLIHDIEQIQDKYSSQVKHFTSWLRVNHRELDELAIGDYFKVLNESDVSASTIRVRRQAVKKRVRQLFQNTDHATYQRIETVLKRLDEDPETKAPKIQDAPIGTDKVLDPYELKRLLGSATQRQACFIAFLWQTGCRVSEMIGTKHNHVIEQTDKAVTIRVIGKGLKERRVKITQELYRAILATFQGETYLFETDNSKPYSRSYVSNQIKGLGKRAIGRNISAHSLRHSFASRKVQQLPGKAEAISKYLGHAKVSTTLGMYVHSSLSEDELLDDQELFN